MKKNLIKRFQDFWDTLTEKEKTDLWDILTALRGPDEGGDTDTIKKISTARIRGELLGPKHARGIYSNLFVYCSAASLTKAVGSGKEISSYTIRDTVGGHFAAHLNLAICALKKHIPEKRIRDLLKLL